MGSEPRLRRRRLRPPDPHDQRPSLATRVPVLTCPRDFSLLRRTKLGNGVAFVCDTCQGRAVTMALLRRQLEPQRAQELWSRTLASTTWSLPCPSCSATGVRVDLPLDGVVVELDVCRTCACVWFDAGERERVPDAPPPPTPEDDMPLELRQRLAILEVEDLARRAREDALEQPNLSLPRLPALLGLPVELESTHHESRPWLTWGVAAAIAATSVTGFLWPPLTEALQMVPEDLARTPHTLLTSFFVHANWWHLLSNLWMLVLFGDDVEQVLGRGTWWMLVVCSTLAGSVLHCLLDPRGDVPCVGASAGISGLAVCYAMLWPDARLGKFVRVGWHVKWITFSARTALGIWVAIQLVLVVQQWSGSGSVSAFAHLGGALVGLMAWNENRERTHD